MSENKLITTDPVAALAAKLASPTERINMASQFGLRDESKQKVKKATYIRQLKNVKNKASNLLIVCDLVLPFDPSTGEESQDFNSEVCFRSSTSSGTTMKALKKLYQDDAFAGGKQRLMAEAGVEEWVVSDASELTKKDLTIFKEFLKPRTFTVEVITVNVPVITGLKFGKEYLVHLERDPETDEIIGEIPLPIKLGHFLNDFYGAQYYAWLEEEQKLVDAGSRKALTDDEKKEKAKEVFGHIVVSKEFPSNRTLAFEFELNESSDMKYKELLKLEPQELFNKMVLIKHNKKFNVFTDLYHQGKRDKYILENGYWLGMLQCGPDEDPQALGQSSSFNNPSDISLASKDQDAVDLLLKCAQLLDQPKLNIEDVFSKSVRIKEFDPALETQLVQQVAQTIDWDSKFLNEVLVTRHLDVLSLMGPRAEALIEKYALGDMIVTKSNLSKEQSKFVNVTAVEEMGDEGSGANIISETSDSLTDLIKDDMKAGTSNVSDTPVVDGNSDVEPY